MSSSQLAKHSENNITLTLAEIFRNDQFGEWSFKEIGFRIQENHPQYKKNHHNFSVIDIPRSTNSKNSWEVAVKLVHKNKTASEIQSIINFMAERNLFPKAPKAMLG